MSASTPKIPISFFKPQLMKKENRYAPGWKPNDTDFYTEMFAIRDGVYYDVVSEIRKEPDHDKRQEIKGKKLKAITISATIENHRSIKNSKHTGLLNIDVDPKENPEITDWPAVRDMIFEMPEVVSSFLSVSEQGVTFVVKIDPTKHKDTFFSIKDELFDNFNIRIDKGTHDICRLRYVSFDKDARIRTDFDNIPITYPSDAYLENKKQRKQNIATLPQIQDKDSEKAFDCAVKKAESKYGSFADGHKHFFLAVLGGFCNTIGMSQDYCEGLVLQRFSHYTDIDNDLLLRPIRNVYRTYKSQHSSAPEREISSRLNDKITGAFVSDFIRKGITPKESDISHIAEKYEANIERVREVKDRVIDEYSDEKELDFAHTPQQLVVNKEKDISFWIIDDDDKITIDKRMFKEFLTNRGVYRYRVTLDKWILIRIQENIVSEINKADLKLIVTNYLDKVRRYDVYQYIANNVTKTFSDDWLELLPEADIEFKKDDKDSVNIFYENGFLSITAKDRILKPYTELDGFIWNTQILKRKYKEIQNRPKSDFERFVYNVSGGSSVKNEVELSSANKRFGSICTALGYLLHDFKDPACSPAVIFNDEVISENPEGRTGKGLLAESITHFKNTVTFDGKSFSFDKSFTYQKVELDTKIMFFDDVKKNFNFEMLFSVITNGIDVEKKGRGTFTIPFKESPKVVVATNYAIKGSGGSNDARRFELELHRHYTKDYTPRQEFGKLFFSEWNDEEWNVFDLFMSECAALYLKKGLVAQELVNLPEKRLINNTSQDFVEFMDEYTRIHTPEKGASYRKPEIFTEFLVENENSKSWLTNRTFCKWCRLYFDFHEIQYVDDQVLGAKIFRFM